MDVHIFLSSVVTAKQATLQSFESLLYQRNDGADSVRVQEVPPHGV